MQDGEKRRYADRQPLFRVYMFFLDPLRTLARGQATEGSRVALGVALRHPSRAIRQ
jgi:hypothetical protein